MNETHDPNLRSWMVRARGCGPYWSGESSQYDCAIDSDDLTYLIKIETRQALKQLARITVAKSANEV